MPLFYHNHPQLTQSFISPGEIFIGSKKLLSLMNPDETGVKVGGLWSRYPER
jgi:hypothetical protein